MGLVLLLSIAQVTFQTGDPIRLDLPPIPFERVTVTRTFILLADETERVVHIFGRDGSHRARLGAREEIFQLPSRVSYLDTHKMITVYDGAGRFFSFWNEQGRLVSRKETEFDLFFTVGRLVPVDGGFVAPVSLTHRKYLLAQLDRDFKITDYNYEVIDERLVEMSPVVRQAFAAPVQRNGGSGVVAAQSLSQTLQFFDAKLKPTGTVEIAEDRWQNVNYRRLGKVSKNPRELEKLQTSFSEIIGLEAIGKSLFVVGIRNPKGAAFSYQSYDATAAKAVGQPFDSDHRLVGAFGPLLYLRDLSSDAMTLIPCRVQP